MNISHRIDNTTDNINTNIICPPPVSVKIELTSKCNLKCNFCAHNTANRINSEMNINLFDSIVKDLKQYGVNEIGLFYLGESLMCSWLDEAISICKKKYDISYVFLTTNGIMLNGNKIEKIFENGLDSLKFSYNFYDRETYSVGTNCHGGLFDILNSNIKLSKKIRDDNNFKCGIFASTIDHLNNEKMIECLQKNVYPYVDEHYFLPLYNHGGFVKDKNIIKGGNIGRLDNPRDPIPCWALYKESHITVDGKVSACCFDHSYKFIMGDCNIEKFSNIWNNENYQNIRKLHLTANINELKSSVCSDCLFL